MTDLNKEREAFAQTEFNTFGLDVKDFKTTGEYFMFIGWLLRSEQEKSKAQAVPETHIVVPKGVLDLTRFMCKTWAEIDNFVYKNCTNLGEYPVIQGTSNQFNLAKIGNQKADNKSIHSAVMWFLESESGAEG